MHDGKTRRRRRPAPPPAPVAFLLAHRATLVVLEGSGAGREIPLDRARMEMGRGEEVALRFDDQAMSRQHATFEALDHCIRVRDLGSTNSVMVNGSPVLAAELKHGDRIEIGAHVFQYVVEAIACEPRVHVIEDD
jgi:pSer/pThr/pTyr-binding forkhead associated (FHA) protein